MVNSIEKGKRGEREFSKVCRDQGYEVRRTQQYCGKTEESADCIGLPGIHIEVKRVEKLNLSKAMEQSCVDALDGGLEEDGQTFKQRPIVAHKKNNEPWLITMTAHDWFALYREWEAGKAIDEFLRLKSNNDV